MSLVGLSADILFPRLPDLHPPPRGTFYFEARTKNGTEFATHVRFCALTLEAQSVLMMTIEDMSARKQAEQEIAQRTAQLEAANKDLEAFAYSVSHDLRAPLRAIGGFSQILEEDYEADLPEQARHYLKLVREGTIQMGP